MAKRDEFDDETFLDKFLKRKQNAKLPLGLRRIFIAGGILLLLIVLVTVLFSALPGGGSTDGKNLPLIRADKTPLRVKPEEPGGMAVPNKDSTIFDTLKGQREEGEIENLLEDSGDTASVAREEVASKVEKKTEPLVDLELEEEEVAPAVADQKIEQEAAKSPDENPSVESVIETLKQENKIEAAKAEPMAPKPVQEKTELSKPASISSDGSTYIQLAAVKSEAEASAQWTKFKSKNPELNALTMRVQKADLGAKGVFYRIQAGPLTQDKAASTCSSVKSRGGNCIIVK